MSLLFCTQDYPTLMNNFSSNAHGAPICINIELMPIPFCINCDGSGRHLAGLAANTVIISKVLPSISLLP